MSHVKSRSPWRRLLFVAYGMTWPSCHRCSKYSNSMPLDFSRLIKFSVELGGRLDARARAWALIPLHHSTIYPRVLF